MSGYHGDEHTKDENDNHSNQLNPNNDAYWESRGYDMDEDGDECYDDEEDEEDYSDYDGEDADPEDEDEPDSDVFDERAERLDPGNRMRKEGRR